MENSIIVPFDLNTARKIKSGEIEGSVLIDNIEIEFVYESKDCAGPYNLLFVKKDGYGISAIYANTEGCTIGGTTLELKVEAGAYFKKGDVLTSTNGYQFIYDGIITKGVMGCICGMASFGDIGFDYKLWTDVYDEYRKRHVRKAIEEEKKFLAEKIIKAEDSRKIDIIKRYLSEYEYLLDEMPKRDFKPFERVLVRRTNQERGKLHLFSRESVGDNKYECLGGVGFRKIEDATEVANLLVRSRAFKVNSKYLNRSYERLNVINEGVVPAVEGCVGYTNEEFERVNKENNDPESEKIGSFNKTVEEANNIRSRVLKYVDKIKQERAYNIDLCMTFERYIEIADKDAERAMAFLKEAYPFNEETEVFIRKRYNMSIGVDPEEN